MVIYNNIMITNKGGNVYSSLIPDFRNNMILSLNTNFRITYCQSAMCIITLKEVAFTPNS